MANSCFLQACRRQRCATISVWLMRQAGRYLPQFRTLHEKYGFAHLLGTPELACEVRLLPIRAFGLDAAIIFADITPLLVGLGLKFEMVKGEEPVVSLSLRTAAEANRIQAVTPEESVGYMLEAVHLVRRELESQNVPIIGFSGAPFTLACYAIEGGRSTSFPATKAFMMSQPSAWHQLLSKLRELVGECMLAQARAGADSPAGSIFNLGHGVIPATPPENVRRWVDFVHEYPLQEGRPC